MPDDPLKLVPLEGPHHACSVHLCLVPASNLAELSRRPGPVPEERAKELVAGYWPRGRRSGQVREALHAGKRVLIVGYAQRRVVRAFEVVAADPDWLVEFDNGQYRRMKDQPDDVKVNDAPFATVYEADDAGMQWTKLRYHCETIDDAALKGRLIYVQDPPAARQPIAWQTGLFARFADEADESLFTA